MFVQADIDQTAAISAGSYVTAGTPIFSSTYIQITNSSTSQAGMVLFSTIQTVANGFNATFTHSPSLCSATPADG